MTEYQKRTRKAQQRARVAERPRRLAEFRREQLLADRYGVLS